MQNESLLLLIFSKGWAIVEITVFFIWRNYMDMVNLVCVCVCVHVRALTCSCVCTFSINDVTFTVSFEHILS
jgi:hypothetical protein